MDRAILPVQGDELASYLQSQRDRVVPLDSGLVASYIEFIESAAPATREHEILLALQRRAAGLYDERATAPPPAGRGGLGSLGSEGSGRLPRSSMLRASRSAVLASLARSLRDLAGRADTDPFGRLSLEARVFSHSRSRLITVEGAPRREGIGVAEFLGQFAETGCEARR